MSEQTRPAPGFVGWVDLTVEDAPRVRDFYREVVGWETSDVDMGGYSDYWMLPPGGSGPVAGVCHARGANAALPPVWLVYITVADLEHALARCRELGGEVLTPPRTTPGYGSYAVIRDLAGAVAALFQAA
jgi:uncharacterized protein